jgi:pimeloyl-ACP methyl ester carboxylesterase
LATFGLIHGAHHGAWCWRFLVPELEALGHRAVAMDLPAEDTTAGVSHYAKVAVDALAEIDDDLVLVGHSLGGIVAPLVATQRPVRHLVYLAGLVPEPGRPLADQQAETPPELQAPSTKIDNGDGTWTRGAGEAARVYYHDCSDERRRFAIARLRRQSRTPNNEPSPLLALPDVPTSYIVCRDDRAVHPDLQRRMARLQLGVQPMEIPGSHAPFLARPRALAAMLAGTP